MQKKQVLIDWLKAAGGVILHTFWTEHIFYTLSGLIYATFKFFTEFFEGCVFSPFQNSQQIGQFICFKGFFVQSMQLKNVLIKSFFLQELYHFQIPAFTAHG